VSNRLTARKLTRAIRRKKPRCVKTEAAGGRTSGGCRGTGLALPLRSSVGEGNKIQLSRFTICWIVATRTSAGAKVSPRYPPPDGRDHSSRLHGDTSSTAASRAIALIQFRLTMIQLPHEIWKGRTQPSLKETAVRGRDTLEGLRPLLQRTYAHPERPKRKSSTTAIVPWWRLIAPTGRQAAQAISDGTLGPIRSSHEQHNRFSPGHFGERDPVSRRRF
jgi:hypothetical protein